jgi:hypothetical protein
MMLAMHPMRWLRPVMMLASQPAIAPNTIQPMLLIYFLLEPLCIHYHTE